MVNIVTDKWIWDNQDESKPPKPSNRYGHVQSGWYDINGKKIYFRSKWEANIALYLDFLIRQKKIKSWEFEPDIYVFDKIKLGTRGYRPDFKVWNNDGTFHYEEVKGHFDAKSLTKLKRMKKYYPDIKVNVIDKDGYKSIKDTVGKMLRFY